jgi:hypothetical protein
MPTIGARLKNDGTLLTAGELDEYNATPNQHRITVDNIFAEEFDEVSLDDATPSGGSILFNGTNQKLLLSGSADFQFGTNNFTIEGWFYVRSGAYQRLWCFELGDNVEVYGTTLYYWNGTTIANSGINTVRPWSWFHVALVKLDGEVKVYYNGTAVITDSSPYNSTTSRPLAICGELPSGDIEGYQDNPSGQDGWLDGYMTNFRIIKGTAAYTADFNISYSPLTAESGTKLLLTVVDKAGMITDTSGTSKTVSNVGGAVYDGSSPLSTAGNGVMKQLKTGTLQVTNEFDEYIGGAASII